MKLIAILALVVKISWPYSSHDLPIQPTSTYNLWRAPLNTSTFVNDVGDTISVDTCGTFTKLGGTTGNWILDTKPVQGSTYCYAISEVTSESQTDLLTGVTSIVKVESPRSEPIVVTVTPPIPLTTPSSTLTSGLLRASILN